MLDEIIETLRGFAALFRRGGQLPWTILMPMAVIAVTWPILTKFLPSEHEAFMVAFMLAMALRFAMRADGRIRSIQTKVQNRTALILVLLLGPGVMALLIWKGEPLWCQRFVSFYFLLLAGLYMLDVVDGRNAMVRYFLPEDRPHGADPLMTRVLAVCYMALVLLNETLIAHLPETLWLIYFGLLPIFLQRLMVAVMRTVDQAWAAGIGRL